ncbi:hypothetical protein BDV12DRAFT_44020 [Aspergillus spectabilis]
MYSLHFLLRHPIEDTLLLPLLFAYSSLDNQPHGVLLLLLLLPSTTNHPGIMLYSLMFSFLFMFGYVILSILALLSHHVRVYLPSCMRNVTVYESEIWAILCSKDKCSVCVCGYVGR